MAYRMEFSRTVTKLLSNFEESQLLDISPGHGCMLVGLAFANSITCGGQKKKMEKKKEGGVEREIIEIVQMTWPSIHLMSICPTDIMRLEIGLSCPHSHSKPEPTLNHIWSQLKKPQRAPVRREKFTVLGLWDGTVVSKTEPSHRIFKDNMDCSPHAADTLPLEPSLVQETTPTSIHGQREWKILQCLTNLGDFYCSLIYLHVTADTSSESLTWPKGQIIIPFNCDKSPWSRQIFDSQLISKALVRVTAPSLGRSFPFPLGLGAGLSEGQVADSDL